MKEICIFAKPPIPGRSKSRIAAVFGEDAAAELTQILLRNVIHDCRLANPDKIILYHPPEFNHNDYSLVDTTGLEFCSQLGNDLGERISHLFETRINGTNQVLLIGGDCVIQNAGDLSDLLNALNQYHAVIQPAEDGGYVSIGFSRFIPEAFQNIPWSTSKVFDRTIENFKKAKCSYQVFEFGFDVDGKEDIKKLIHFSMKKKMEGLPEWLKKYFFKV